MLIYAYILKKIFTRAYSHVNILRFIYAVEQWTHAHGPQRRRCRRSLRRCRSGIPEDQTQTRAVRAVDNWKVGSVFFFFLVWSRCLPFCRECLRPNIMEKIQKSVGMRDRRGVRERAPSPRTNLILQNIIYELAAEKGCATGESLQ